MDKNWKNGATPPALEEFNAKLPCPIRDERLLQNVFVHTSFLNEPAGAGLLSNERLEFLGDAILSLVVSRILFETFPSHNEGDLTQMRARLVNKRALASLATGLDMSRFLLLGRGETREGGSDNPTILAGVFEALVAALYLDAGIEKCASFIEGLFSPLIKAALNEPGHFDYKPALQELSQKIFKSPPIYRQTRESGPPHKRIFEVEVEVNGEVLGRGAASRKKDAEQEAAREALEKLNAAARGATPDNKF